MGLRWIRPCNWGCFLLECLSLCLATMAILEFSPKPSQTYGTWVVLSACPCILAPFSVFKNQIIFYYIGLDMVKSSWKNKSLQRFCRKKAYFWIPSQNRASISWSESENIEIYKILCSIIIFRWTSWIPHLLVPFHFLKLDSCRMRSPKVFSRLPSFPSMSQYHTMWTICRSSVCLSRFQFSE